MAVKTLAVITARGGSRRLPGKNIRPFLGRPLIHWSIEFAQRLHRFNRIVVSTDSDEIAACCEDAGLHVPDRRPSELATDTTSSVAVVLHALVTAESLGESFELVALLQPTSPIRESPRWIEAFDFMTDHACSAVIGVSPVRDHPFRVFRQNSDCSLVPWNNTQGLGVRSQDLPSAVFVNGGLYLIRADELKTHKTLFPAAIKGVLCKEPWESLDIDTEADWVAAEALAAHYGKRP